MSRIGILLILLIALEIWLLVQIGGRIGAGNMVLWCLLSAVAGALLFRLVGRQVLMEAQRQMQAGEPPVQSMLDGLSLALAGVALIVPGVLSDAFGLILALPLTRRLIGAVLVARLFVASRRKTGGGPKPGPGVVIDGEFTDITDTDPPDTPPANDNSGRFLEQKD